jgi:hypothetical protein
MRTAGCVIANAALRRSSPADLGAEELVRAQGLTALLAIDRRDRRERRAARLAAAQELPAALGAFVRDLRLELLEPPPRRAAPEADGDPVAEHLATLFA